MIIDARLIGKESKKIIDSETINIQTSSFKNKRILIVDDNKLNLKVASRLLVPYELNIDTVECVAECLEKVKKNCYNLILMDDMMPKMGGTDTLKELQKTSKFKTPVIALTANAMTGMKEKYLSLGFNDYLAKPIDKLELNRVLKTYLDNDKNE